MLSLLPPRAIGILEDVLGGLSGVVRSIGRDAEPICVV